ncbi:hypothetical protein CVT25_002742 [Psilocybe cyanescens]|uniref:Uncharacterized protein n=1 Tax=Psilocybe cyanescens TaxID=93625 RepID=A0A409WLA6_PSICY|nr:hypothetical protein CVT25_002742 [Psilocybe cyanescens]
MAQAGDKRARRASWDADGEGSGSGSGVNMGTGTGYRSWTGAGTDAGSRADAHKDRDKEVRETTGGINAATRTRTLELEDLKIRVGRLEAESAQLREEVKGMRQHGGSVEARERDANVRLVVDADSAKQYSEEGLVCRSRQSHQHEEKEEPDEEQRAFAGNGGREQLIFPLVVPAIGPRPGERKSTRESTITHKLVADAADWLAVAEQMVLDVLILLKRNVVPRVAGSKEDASESATD